MRAPLKPTLLALGLVPLLRLVWRFFSDRLGANPVEALEHATGNWALRFLCLTLLVTPLHTWGRWQWPLPLRRPLGLFAFFYATLHFAIYALFDQELDFAAVLRDIGKRPYILVGFTGFVLLLPLAITSTNKMVRRVGFRRWKTLHRLTYLIAMLGVLHFWWSVKADISEPLFYAVVVALLLAVRMLPKPRRRATG